MSEYTNRAGLEDGRIGAVTLRVRDLAASLSFYEGVLGLMPERSTGGAALRTSGGDEILIRLVEAAGAAPKPDRALGLYHFALLVPDRPSLARILRRLAHQRWPLQGASDHDVSEALYLSDPDGHGIEIYRDRARDEWRYADGRIIMTTNALDLESLLAEASEPAGLAEGTRMGHIHLHVSDLRTAEAFYSGELGMDVTVRGYPGALFLSYGGYHHHLGVNTWAGSNAEPPNDDRIGMAGFEIVAGTRVEDRGTRVEALRDPDGNTVLFGRAQSTAH